MKEEDRKKIQICFVDLVADLFLDDLLDWFFQKDVISGDDIERIKNETTCKDKNRKFLDILQRKGPESFSLLCEGLDKTKQDHVAEYLRKAKPLTDTDDNDGSEKDAIECIVQELFELADGKISVIEAQGTVMDELRKEGQIEIVAKWNTNLTIKTIEHIFPTVTVISQSPERKKRKDYFQGLGCKKPTDSINEDSHLASVESQLASGQSEYSKEDGMVELNNMGVEDVCRCLSDVTIKNDIETDYVLTVIRSEKITGQVFQNMTKEDMKNYFPALKFGEQMTLLISRTNLRIPTSTIVTKNDDISEQKLVISTTSFRRFDTSTKPTDKYRMGSTVCETETRPHNLIRPVHRFQIPMDVLDEKEMLKFIGVETVKFASACMNEKTNATIHFGISAGETDNHTHGEVVGLHIQPKKCDGVITDAIRHFFFDDQIDKALCCIRPPQIVEVIDNNHEMVSRFVVEVDVVPKSSVTSDDVFFLKPFKDSKTTDKSMQFFRYRNGEIEQLDMLEAVNFMKQKTVLFLLRKEQDEETVKKICDKNPIQELKDFLCCGGETLEASLFPFLFVNSTAEYMDNDYLKKHFTFLKVIPWRSVFDFDPNSYSSGLFSLMENQQNKVFKIFTFDDIQNDNQAETFEDIKLSSSGPWFFCNGYESLGQEKLDALKWNRERNGSFRNVLNFFDKEVPSDRARYLFFVLSQDVDVFVEAATEVLKLFGDQWLVIAETETLLDLIKVKLFSRNVADMDTLKHKCKSLPWLHVCEAVNKMGDQNNEGTLEISVSSGSCATVSEQVKFDLSDLEILGYNECETDQKLSTKEAEDQCKKVEKEFFRGEEVSWWNFMYQDQVLQRSEHDKLKTLVQEALTGDDEKTNIGRVTVFHHPGAGGTTTAKNVLWDFRKQYRCCKVDRITNHTCQQICMLRCYKDEDNPKPPLVFIDNEDEDKLCNLCNSLMEESVKSGSDIFCVLLICLRRTMLPFEKPDKQIMLKHELKPNELEWFKRKYEDLMTKHNKKQGIHPKVLISFNIMKDNFKHESIERAVKEFVISLPDKELHLLTHVAFLNTFDLDFNQIPIPCFDPIMGIRDARTGRYSAGGWNNRLGQSIRVLLNVTRRTSLGGKVPSLRIINPLLSDEILRVVGIQQKLTVGEIARNFIQSPIFAPKNECVSRLINILKNMMKKREWKMQGKNVKKESMCPILKKLVESGDVDSAVFLVEFVFDLSGDPMVAQQVARLYMHQEMWDKAEQCAEKAVLISSQNSYLWHTYGEIYKTQVLKMSQKCTTGSKTLTDNDCKEAFKLTLQAIDMYKKVQADQMNMFGHSGEVEIILIFLDTLRLMNCFRSHDALRKCLLNPEYAATRVGIFQLDDWKRIHDLLNSSFEALEVLEIDLFHKNNDPITQSKAVLAFKNGDRLSYLKTSLGAYCEENQHPQNLNPEDQCEMHRQRMKMMGGTSLMSILKMGDDENGEQILKTMYGMMKENITSEHVILLDYRRAFSCLLALQSIGKLFLAESDIKHVFLWIRELFNQRKTGCLLGKEACFYYTLFHWPSTTKEQMEKKDDSPLSLLVEALQAWKKCVDTRQHKNQNIKAIFYLTKDTAKTLDWILHFKHLGKAGAGLRNQFRSRFALSRLERLCGTLTNSGREIDFQLISVQGVKGPRVRIPLFKPLSFRPALNNKEVWFVLGFTLDGPLAYDVDDNIAEEKIQVAGPRFKHPKQRHPRPARPIPVYNHDDFCQQIMQLYDQLGKINHALQFQINPGLAMHRNHLIGKINDLEQRRMFFYQENL